MPNDNPKFCVNCVHHYLHAQPNGAAAKVVVNLCAYGVEPSLVTGKPAPSEMAGCGIMRADDGACGPDGKHFEQGPPFPPSVRRG